MRKNQRPLRIIGLNPGSKYLGIAVFQGSDLRDWGIKVIKGKWSKAKVDKIRKILSIFIEQYELTALAIKQLHPSRGSPELRRLVTGIRKLFRRKGLKVYQYSLKELENWFSPEEKINKKEMAEMVALDYPFLFKELEKEKRNKNPYFIRMFEAVALGIRCFAELDH